MPRGGYVPQFRYRAGARIAHRRSPSVAPAAPRGPHQAFYAVAAAALLLAWRGGGGRDRCCASSPIMSDIASQLPPAPRATSRRAGSPSAAVVLVEPIHSAANAPFARELGAIRARLTEALARFDDIEVVADPPAQLSGAREPGRRMSTG